MNVGHIVILTFVLLVITSSENLLKAQSQIKDTSMELVQALEVDSVFTGLWVYHSKGFKERALAIGNQLESSNTFFNDSLLVRVDFPIVFLDSMDYVSAFPNEAPYGLPRNRREAAILPADLTKGTVVNRFLGFENSISEQVTVELESLGLTYSEAARDFVDLIGLHELGHRQADTYGLNAKQRWLREFLASYFAYTYLRSHEPDMAAVQDVISEVQRKNYEPTYTLLEDLNRIYTGVGGGNYGWYQCVFLDRIRSVYDAQGMSFLSKLRGVWSDSEWEPESAEDLLMALEEIAPGFNAWADRYKLR